MGPRPVAPTTTMSASYSSATRRIASSAGRSSTSSTATETDASTSWATSTALPYTLTSATTLKRTRTPSSVNRKTSCVRALSSMPMTDPRHRHDEQDPPDEVVCRDDDQQTYTWGA